MAKEILNETTQYGEGEYPHLFGTVDAEGGWSACEYEHATHGKTCTYTTQRHDDDTRVWFTYPLVKDTDIPVEVLDRLTAALGSLTAVRFRLLFGTANALAGKAKRDAVQKITEPSSKNRLLVLLAGALGKHGPSGDLEIVQAIGSDSVSVMQTAWRKYVKVETSDEIE
jgi:hypothetical protein